MFASLCTKVKKNGEWVLLYLGAHGIALLLLGAVLLGVILLE